MARDRTNAGGIYYGWTIVLLCSLSAITPNLLPLNCFSLFLHDWTVQFHTPASTLQLGVLVVGIGTALLSPAAGIIVDRFPARLLFVSGLVCSGLFCAGIAAATAVWQFLALFAVVLPLAFLLSGALLANTLISRWFTRRRGLALATNMVIPGVVGIVMPPIVAMAIPVTGWRTIWAIGCAFIVLIVLPLVAWLLRERPDTGGGEDAMNPAVGINGGALAAAMPAGPDIGVRQIVARRTFWVLVLAYLPMLALYLGCSATIAPVVGALGFGKETAGWLLSMMSFSHVLTLLLIGLLADRFGNRLPMTGLIFATAVGGALFAIGRSPGALALAMLLVGSGASFWPILASVIGREYGVAAVGRGFGLASFFIPVASLAPFAIARVQEVTGSTQIAFGTLALLCALGGVVWLVFVRETPPAHASGTARRVAARSG